jgi:hypothetical protein
MTVPDFQQTWARRGEPGRGLWHDQCAVCHQHADLALRWGTRDKVCFDCRWDGRQVIEEIERLRNAACVRTPDEIVDRLRARFGLDLAEAEQMLQTHS